MNINDFIKILKRASEVQIDYKKDQNNGFVAIIKGIINDMDNKKKKISKIDLVLLEMREGFRQVKEEFAIVNARLDRLESDMVEVKQRLRCLETEARKHGWNV